MALLDVNALVALAWDSHIHHVRIREWFADNAENGWATCPITESGFVRVSANPRVLASPIGIGDAQAVLAALRAHGGHHFLSDDVSQVDGDLPKVAGYRQVTDAHLLTLARRHSVRLVTFDAAAAALGQRKDVELLTAL
ncbi:MAG TPA: TA system VapC family ribonuclease toxin [Mycobacterium sp.]